MPRAPMASTTSLGNHVGHALTTAVRADWPLTCRRFPGKVRATSARRTCSGLSICRHGTPEVCHHVRVQRGFAWSLDELDAASCVHVSGELDLHTVEALLPTLEQALSAGNPVILDCAAVTFMDSTALGHIHTFAQEAHARQRCFVLVAAQPSVLKVLRITGLAAVLPIVADLDAAQTYVRITRAGS
jgi:anti-sigma B factor antagonist